MQTHCTSQKNMHGFPCFEAKYLQILQFLIFSAMGDGKKIYFYFIFMMAFSIYNPVAQW